jgi:L-ascorbate metabolism protein UlaG (beta-lactamase superfamily)
MLLLVVFSAVALVTLLFYFTTDRLAQFGAKPEGARLERLKLSSQHNGQKFVNAHPVSMSFGFSDITHMLYQWFFAKQARVPKGVIPTVQLNAASFDNPPESGLRVTWLGHSTAIIEIDGVTILTDPVWKERSSPSSIVGPKRFFPVPIKIEDLPPIDAVLISHDHFDHLDMHTVQKLAELGIPLYVPLGVGAHLEKWGISENKFTELDWWDSVSVGERQIQLIATPARHFSGRGLFNGSDPTLWITFVIVGPDHCVFFCGDTGVYPELTDIGEKYGPFDITLMKIGAYGDKWPDIHLTPEQAVHVHLALRGELLLPIHWGTFNLAFHDWFEPPERLLPAATANDVQCIIPKPGEMVTPGEPVTNERWWNAAR